MTVELTTCPRWSFQEIKNQKEEILWNKLDTVSVDFLLNDWLETLSYRTRINYVSGIRLLSEAGLLNPMLTLQSFSLINHDNIIDKIKQLPSLQETTRQARAALYISFTRFLSRRFPEIFKKAMPSREGTSKTFYRVHEKVKTEAMNLSQWTSFFGALEKINFRDCLIAKVTLQGGKRIREVLALQVDQIDWIKREITFTQSKTKGVRKETVITYPEKLMISLKEYIGDRRGYVFVSRNNQPLVLTQVAITFFKAGLKGWHTVQGDSTRFKSLCRNIFKAARV